MIVTLTENNLLDFFLQLIQVIGVTKTLFAIDCTSCRS